MVTPVCGLTALAAGGKGGGEGGGDLGGGFEGLCGRGEGALAVGGEAGYEV